MKYVEQVKSFILTVLVLLSVTFTYLIWSYKPVYPTIEETIVNDVSLGEKKELEAVLKPTKVVFRENNSYTGNVSTTSIDDMMKILKKLEIEQFILMGNDLKTTEMDRLMQNNDQVSLFYSTTMPLNQYMNVLKFKESEIPQASFNRLIMNWESIEEENVVVLYFLNTEASTIYRAKATVPQKEVFKRSIARATENYIQYMELGRDTAPALYVAAEKTESIQYEYYTDEISSEVFKNMLFADTSIVQRNIESAQSEKFTDGMALMTIDKLPKSVHYVYPAAEGMSELSPGKLLRDSFEFINEHGGYTDDYRYVGMDVEHHMTEYQLFVQGFPVFSNTTLTRITTTWGDDRIFRYRRPYFTLDIGDQTIKELPSVQEMIQYIRRNNAIDLEKIDDIVIGYHLSQSQDSRLFTLDPSWFVIEGKDWIKIDSNQIGEEG